MAINYETILSSYDDRLTLLEFMNRVLDALENASVDATHFSSLGNGQYTFSIDFADGSSVESAPVTINGANGVSSFSASNGVLSIGLTDGSTLSANPMNGDISISGSLDVSGPVSVRDQSGIDVDGPLSVSGNVSVGGNLHVVTQLDVDDESDFAGHVEMHNGLEITNDLTVNGNIVQQIDLDGAYSGQYVSSADFDFEPSYSSICRVGDVINIQIKGWFSPHNGFTSRDEETIYKIGLPIDLGLISDDWDNVYVGTCVIYNSNGLEYVIDTFRLKESSPGVYDLILWATGNITEDSDYQLSISFQILVSPDLNDGRP